MTQETQQTSAQATTGHGPVHRAFVSYARRHPFALAFTDVTGRRVSYAKAVAGGVVLARALRLRWQDQQHVGILLPPSIGAALVNLAASLSGRTSVNLNYTAGAAGMASAAKQANLRTVVTSKKFLSKARVEVPEGVEPIWIEELAGSVGGAQRVAAMLAGLLFPKALLERFAGARRSVGHDDTATVIFSSGSTGDPKGVVLSHRNVDSNSKSVAEVMPLSGQNGDRMLGILPLFHSFGYMALWYASNNGMSTVFHPNPLDAQVIGDLVQKNRITFMVATPTFLQIYMRQCTPEQFEPLRMVIVGAEKLRDRLAMAFEERFGLRPLEGYGTTECAPVIAVSAPDSQAGGVHRIGNKLGSVGRPLPGIDVRIVDPDTSEPLPIGESGMLLVNGPNVMDGYLGRKDLTDEVLRDGWYTTGDIAVLDEDGFLKITDRLSRFSKIGGEMVPHGGIEQALHDAGDFDVQTFAVTGVPDERKGERLVVLHTTEDDRLPGVVDRLKGMGLPKLFIPKVDQFVKVEALPTLGTGKLDLRAIKQLASEVAGGVERQVPLPRPESKPETSGEPLAKSPPPAEDSRSR